MGLHSRGLIIGGILFASEVWRAYLIIYLLFNYLFISLGAYYRNFTVSLSLNTALFALAYVDKHDVLSQLPTANSRKTSIFKRDRYCTMSKVLNLEVTINAQKKKLCVTRDHVYSHS